MLLSKFPLKNIYYLSISGFNFTQYGYLGTIKLFIIFPLSVSQHYILPSNPAVTNVVESLLIEKSLTDS